MKVKQANDPTKDYKTLVRQGYDRCAVAYDRARLQETEPALALLIPRLLDGTRVLDLGCGAGVPVARQLADHFEVTGVDLSGAMVDRARVNVPGATFVQADIMALDFTPESFDAVVSFYAIFHLPREEHVELFRRVHRWLKPGGYFMATLSAVNELAYTEDDFFGETMYWSNYSFQEYRAMLEGAGFDILDTTVQGHGYDSEGEATDEHHPIVLVRKRGEGWHDQATNSLTKFSGVTALTSSGEVKANRSSHLTTSANVSMVEPPSTSSTCS